jgi:hypothetical protein
MYSWRPGFDDLSVEEKIDYLHSLWDRIAATPETVPVSEWHLDRSRPSGNERRNSR